MAELAGVVWEICLKVVPGLISGVPENFQVFC